MKVLLVILSCVALSGCGSQDSATLDGADGTLDTRFSSHGRTSIFPSSDTSVIQMPSDLPAWAPAFPGSKAAQVITQGERGSAIKSVVLTTNADVKTVVAYYNEKIAATGMKTAMAQDTPDGAVRMIESSSGARDMLMIGRSDNSTSISLAYSVYR